MKLLALLFGLLVIAPLLEQFLGLRVLLNDIFTTAVFIYAAYAFSRNRSLLAAAVGLALPAIAGTWLRPWIEGPWILVLGGICNIAFILLIAGTILAAIFREREVSADLIAGAIVVYLLMAVMWTEIYIVLEAARPGSFNFGADAGGAEPALLRYFSLVTITTVGYGDITPTSPAARAFANLESLVGQLYLVIQVAWLVGMHVSARSK